MKEKKKKIVGIVLTIFVLIAVVGISYAFITQTLTGTKEVVVSAGVLDLVLEEENAITISDALPMYDEVGMIQEDVFVFRLVNKTSNPTNYILKLSKIEAANELSTSDVKYYLTKEGIGEPKLLSSLPTDGTIDAGTIAGNDTIDYTLRLWIRDGVADDNVISGKSLSYKLDVEVSQEMAYVPATIVSELVDDSATGGNCKTYDDGVDTFLVGQCSNNYVWYSGKLWRVVLKNNETGAVKMVTDNAITTIPYSDGNNEFENSYMDQWLNQEFLPTLHDYEDYLVVDSIWDATENSSEEPSRPSNTTSVTRTVGLLNDYEYYTTYAKSDNLATYSTGYLNAGIVWWLMTPYFPSLIPRVTIVPVSRLRIVYDIGALNNGHPTGGYGVRPSVNLKSTIQILGGSGIQSDPYILEGDMGKVVNGATLLNTRYSGEYITFNDELYRIVDIENELTKITAVDKPSGLSSNVFDSNNSVIFTNASIKTDLENYYQDLKTSNENVYDMIEPSTIWYLGTVGTDAEYHYKASICAIVDTNTSMNTCTEKATSTTANIGLPRVGEMFTSQITRGTKTSLWTLTPYYATPIPRVTIAFPMLHFVNNYGSLYDSDPTNGNGARPSMYLKSTIKIASSNTGNGTFEKPYVLSLN